jgi:hypothetical protein
LLDHKPLSTGVGGERGAGEMERRAARAHVELIAPENWIEPVLIDGGLGLRPENHIRMGKKPSRYGLAVFVSG